MASRSVIRSTASTSATLLRSFRPAVRTLAVPSKANQASVSDVKGKERQQQQDVGEPLSSTTDGVPIATRLENSDVAQEGGSVEMFGFKLNPVATATGGNAKVSGRPIYLDMQATTPVDPRVLDRMLPYFTNQYGNPHSRTHAYGWEAEAAVDEARAHVASIIGAQAKDIVFTSGATESNNMLVKGIAKFYGPKRNHIITTQTEHKCVLDSCRYLSEQGFEVTYLPVLPNGQISLQALEDAIRPETCLLSIMAVNNEIGVIQPLEEIGQLLKRKQKENGGAKVLFHTDAAQAVGKVPIDVEAMGIDAMSISGHKIYGPKGIGAAYVRRRPRVRLEPLIHGGGQERGLRSGTVPASLVVGLGEACRIAKDEMEVSYDFRHQGIRD